MEHDTQPIDVVVPRWFAARLILWMAGFIALMFLPVFIPEGTKIYDYFIGENKIRLLLILCAYVPLAAAIEIVVFKDSKIKALPRNSKRIKNSD